MSLKNQGTHKTFKNFHVYDHIVNTSKFFFFFFILILSIQMIFFFLEYLIFRLIF